jgi:hypothetical protein
MAAAIPVAAVGGITASAAGGLYSTGKAKSWWEFRDAIAKVYFIERYPGETREEFDVRRRATIKPFAEGTI